MAIHQRLGICAILSLTSYLIFFHACPEKQNDVSTLKNTEFVSTYAPPPPERCDCPDKSIMLKQHLSADEVAELVKQREKELLHYKARRESVLSELMYSVPYCPFKYPIQGFSVKPRTPTIIPGLELHAGHRSSYKVTITVNSGTLKSITPPEGVLTYGDEEAELVIESDSLKMLNYVLARVKFTSKYYHIHSGEIATLKFENHEVQFPIPIKEPELPVLYDMGKGIDSQVTIITTTFLRYDNLDVLIKSIRKFYRTITIVIADHNSEPQKVTGENIHQYIMPPGKGWFAGRNLALSQVTTKYFLWVENDFEFNKATRIERLVRLMEGNPKLDVAGGLVGEQRERIYFLLNYNKGQETDGGCLTRVAGKRYQFVSGWPGCFHTSGVGSFFLARTDAVRKVGFDPRLQRVPQTDFFVDGLGSLMVVSCNDVTVGLQQGTNQTERTTYASYRNPSEEDVMFQRKQRFFQNNLKCIFYKEN